MICSGSLRGVFIAEVKTGEGLELTSKTLESFEPDGLLLAASAGERSPAGTLAIEATDADGFCTLVGLWGLVITRRLLTRASTPPLWAASCPAATRSASLPTFPWSVTMPLLARTWTCVI